NLIQTTLLFFFSSRRRHTRFSRDWSSDVCSSDLSCLSPPRTIAPILAHSALVACLFAHFAAAAAVVVAIAFRAWSVRASSQREQIGRASCRERALVSLAAGSFIQ